MLRLAVFGAPLSWRNKKQKTAPKGAVLFLLAYNTRTFNTFDKVFLKEDIHDENREN